MDELETRPMLPLEEATFQRQLKRSITLLVRTNEFLRLYKERPVILGHSPVGKSSHLNQIEFQVERDHKDFHAMFLDNELLKKQGIPHSGRLLADFWEPISRDPDVALDMDAPQFRDPVLLDAPATLDHPPLVDRVFIEMERWREGQYMKVKKDFTRIEFLGDYYVPQDEEVDRDLIHIRMNADKGWCADIDRTPIAVFDFHDMFRKFGAREVKQIGYMIVANVHAREWLSSKLALNLIKELQNRTDEILDRMKKGNLKYVQEKETLWNLRHYTFYVIPTLNYFGLMMTASQTRACFGTGTSYHQTPSPEDGFFLNRMMRKVYKQADGNRNFPFFWGNRDGCSPNEPLDENYCGPAPLSLTYSRALFSMVRRLRKENRIHVVRDWHAYGNVTTSVYTTHIHKLNCYTESDRMDKARAIRIGNLTGLEHLKLQHFIQFMEKVGSKFNFGSFDEKIPYEATGGMVDSLFHWFGVQGHVDEFGEMRDGFSSRSPSALKLLGSTDVASIRGSQGFHKTFLDFLCSKEVIRNLIAWRRNMNSEAWLREFEQGEPMDIIKMTQQGRASLGQIKL